MAHFFLSDSGSKFSWRLAHFFIDKGINLLIKSGHSLILSLYGKNSFTIVSTCVEATIIDQIKLYLLQIAHPATAPDDKTASRIIIVRLLRMHFVKCSL
jgi:hypothetical protein